MKSIIGLVGPSGAGKTTLLLEMVKRFPDKVGVYKSYTTRPKRSDEDDLFYTFVSADELKQKNARGELLQVSEYAGNFYANDREQIVSVLRTRYGIAAIVEQGVRNLRDAGFSVIVISIVPKGGVLRGHERRQADVERAKTGLAPDHTVINDFASGGLEKAANDLAAIIQTLP